MRLPENQKFQYIFKNINTYYLQCGGILKILLDVEDYVQYLLWISLNQDLLNIHCQRQSQAEQVFEPAAPSSHTNFLSLPIGPPVCMHSLSSPLLQAQILNRTGVLDILLCVLFLAVLLFPFPK